MRLSHCFFSSRFFLTCFFPSVKTYSVVFCDRQWIANSFKLLLHITLFAVRVDKRYVQHREARIMHPGTQHDQEMGKCYANEQTNVSKVIYIAK